jgi:hypothetical protein
MLSIKKKNFGLVVPAFFQCCRSWWEKRGTPWTIGKWSTTAVVFEDLRCAYELVKPAAEIFIRLSRKVMKGSEKKHDEWKRCHNPGDVSSSQVTCARSCGCLYSAKPGEGRCRKDCWKMIMCQAALLDAVLMKIQ